MFENDVIGFDVARHGHTGDVDHSGELVSMWYYGLTTLSTIGYGDYSPKSASEKFILALGMMLGVSVFSYIMGNLIEILAAFNSLEMAHDHRDLTKWIALLSKFSGGTKLKRSLVDKIEKHFDFYWENNPLNAFKRDQDKSIYT